MAEPLAVDAARDARAGSLLGKRVLVSGCGPIGAAPSLSRPARGRRRDRRHRHRRRRARVSPSASARTGRSTSPRRPSALDAYKADKGYFDVLFEASGAEAAFAPASRSCRPRGDHRAARPRRRHDDPDQPDHRQGDRAERHVSLPRGIRAGRGIHRQGPDRREAADHRDHAARQRRRRLSNWRRTGLSR